MLSFFIKNHRVAVDPVSLTLGCLRVIYEADKSRIKEEAIKQLTYIHLVSQIDGDAPFAKINPDEVSPLVKKELYGKYDHKFRGIFDEEFMENAVVEYQLAFEESGHSSVRALDKKLYELNKLIDQTKIEITKSVNRGAVTYVSNFAILNKMMQDLNKIKAARDEAEASVQKGKRGGDIRGQRKMSFLEKRRREAKEVFDKPAESEEEII